MEQDHEIREMDQMEVQEAVQKAIMVQEDQEVVQEVIQERAQVEVLGEVQADQAVMIDPTIHPIEVIMDVMEMQQL